MTRHLVVGAGPVGTATAREAAARGHDVVLASRSGRGPAVPGVTRVAVDATDPTALTALARGCTVVHNALNPTRYDRWAQEWPPMWAALVAAARASGAVLVTVGNLYGYGRPDGPMREGDPLRPVESKGAVRVRMWEQALAAHRAGDFPAAEVRASDYVGAGAVSSATLAMRAVVAGRTARVVGRPDVPHSWTSTGDVARLAVAVAADPAAHGRAWHVPTNAPRTQRELLEQVAAVAGAPSPRISPTPTLVLRAIGLLHRPVRAVADVAYQFEVPFVLDDSAARSRFGLEPTAWDDVLRGTVEDLQGLATTRGGAR